MVADLDALGLLVKVVPHKHMVGTHDRCKTTVEPLVKPQWFVKMSEMAKPAKEAVVSGKLKLIPERMDKTYYNWLDNIRDWCVSRQLWWGHRIPAYYCQDCGETIVSKETVCTCPKCGSNNVKQDEDTLGYMVLLCTLAILYTWLAGQDGRSGLLLPDRCTCNWIRYYLLLGNPYGILRICTYWKSTVPYSIYPWSGP